MIPVEDLKRLRLLANISQRELAKELEVSDKYISMLENRKQKCNEDFYIRWVNAINKIEMRKKTEKSIK